MRHFIYYVLVLVVFFHLQSCQQRIEENQQSAEKSLKAKRFNAAHYNTQLGLAYLHQGERTRAKKKLLLALEQDPSSPDVIAAMAFFLEKTGEIQRASYFYRKALSLAPASGVQLNNYGTFLCRQGHYEESEPYFLNAVKDIHYIHSAGAYENAGLCIAPLFPDRALYYFKRALEQDPKRHQSISEIVRIEMTLHHPNKALDILKQYRQEVSRDANLLKLGIEVAHHEGLLNTEAQFKARLITLGSIDYSGEKNEYDNARG